MHLVSMFLLVVVAAVAVSGTAASASSNVTIPRACVPPHDKYDFCDTSLSMDKRIDSLIGMLTLEEKPYLLVARESPLGNISRLGIPEYDWGGNCIHGVQSRCAPDGRCPTSYPCPNSLGATFNQSVWRGMGSVIGVELRSLWLQNVGENHGSNLPHIGLDCWSPNIGIVRSPRWGRNMETPSEDPLICGLYGTEYSIGLQNGTDSRYLQAVTTLKHFDANSLEGDWGPDGKITRHTVDANISQYDLHSSYLPAFQMSVQKGQAKGVMCSYNAINGVPSCANTWLLNDTLRNAWGFDGYVTSDSGAVVDIYKSHHYTDDFPHTVAVAVKAGCDVESAPWPPNHPWATGGPYIDYLPEAVKAGLIDESDIDQALRHAVGLRFKLGLFDPIENQPYWHIPPEAVRADAHVELARDATRQSLVLLRNERNTLPFKAGQKVAVIGPHTNATGALLGNYLGEICSDGSFNCVQTPFSGLSKANAGGSTTSSHGCDVNSTDTSDFDHAKKVAQDADVVILMMGLDTSIEAEGKDRKDIRLPATQAKLVDTLVQIGKPTVLVLLHGGIVALDNVNNLPSAIVSCGYPGFYGSEAIAEALFGVTNRWGKLAVTWYNSTFQDQADMLSFDMAAYPGRTYRYYQEEPQFPFGFGLSYTSFELAKASEDRVVVLSEDGASQDLKVTLSNSGDREGDEVIMAFFKAKSGTIPTSAPASNVKRQLFAFQRISLDKGKQQDLTFTVSKDDLQLYDADGKPTVYSGDYTITLTNGNAASVSFDVTI